jgi:hypothetical protein
MEEKTKNSKNQSRPQNEVAGGGDIRERLTKFITYSVIAVTIIIAIAAILMSLFGKMESNGLDYVAKTLVPLWATWIGTVLAFYFGKSNFDTATKSYETIINKLTSEERLSQTSIADMMIPFSKMETMDYEDSRSLTIQQILDNKRFKPYNRYAFVDDDQVLRYIIHRNNFAQYIADHVEQALTSGRNPKDTTFGDYIDEYGKSENSCTTWVGEDVYISISDNLLSAARQISSKRNVRDVFVTQNGKSGEPVLGLITDDDILKVMKG